MSDGDHHPAAILLKAGELYLKGENRPAFVQILLDNVRLMLGDEFGRVSIEGRAGKFLLSGCGHAPAALDRLVRVFGINLVDEVFLCPPEVEAVREAALRVMEPFSGAPGSLSEKYFVARGGRRAAGKERGPHGDAGVAALHRGDVGCSDAASGDESRPAAGGFLRQAPSFKVDSKRTWKKFPLISTELSRRVGEDVVTRLGMKVDLGSPGITLKIQIDHDRAYLSVTSRPGAGGLPVGSSGRAVLLLSGGIDSPVAGWYAMRRGLRLQALHFHSPPYTGSAVTKKIEDLAAVLRRYDPGFSVLMAPFTGIQELIRDRVREDYRVVMYRWAMVRIASRVAKDRGLAALVTGENLGQVASQTIDNLASVEKASALPVVRPLVAFDKADTIRRAREIGSYPVSIRKAEDCCSLFVPRHPVTRARPATCRTYDAMLEENGAYDRCIEGLTDL